MEALTSSKTNCFRHLSACMWGSNRNKRTALFTNIPAMASMATDCDNSHEHLPWGISKCKGRWSFATAQECEYPKELCMGIALRAAQNAKIRQKGDLTVLKPRQTPSVHLAQQKAALGSQPRGLRIPATIPEHSSVTTIIVSDPTKIKAALDLHGKQTQPFDCGTGMPHIPVDSKVIKTSLIRKGGELGSETKTVELLVGLPWDKEEFFYKSVQTPHPIQGEAVLPDHTKIAIANMLSDGTDKIQARLAESMSKWLEVNKSLHKAELDLHKQLGKTVPHVAHVVAQKNILVFKKMLQSMGYPDTRVAELLVEGFPLVGTLDRTGVFEDRPSDKVTQGADVRWLYQSAKVIREDLREQVMKEEVTDISREVYKKTAEGEDSEVAKGWASGPFTEEELTQRHGPLWSCCKRFGVSQGDKVRQIDDFSIGFHNACVTMTDKVNVSGVDGIANFIKFWAECYHQAKTDAQEKLRFRVHLSDGTLLVKILHKDYRAGLDLVGKCLDLESAYKQLPVRASHAHLSICAIKNPHSELVEYFEMHALPFGASAAVHGFNRAAMALEHVVTKLFGIPTTHYFDDYTLVMPKAIQDIVVDGFRDALDLLGWKIKGGDKDLPVAKQFIALGVSFDLEGVDLPIPVLRIGNKQSRIDQLCKDVKKILSDKTMTSNQASQLAGKLNFAKSQIFGRAGAVALRAIHRRTQAGAGNASLDANTSWALEWWLRTLQGNPKPREVRLAHDRKPLVIFTDGCCDPDEAAKAGLRAGYGGILFDPENNQYEYFQNWMGDDLAYAFSKQGQKKQIVG